MNLKRDIKSFDVVLALLVVGLLIFGMLMVTSATEWHTGAQTVAQRKVFTNQFVWFATGLVLMALATFVNFEFICKFYIVFYVLNFLLLIMAKYFGSGDGVSRWITLSDLGLGSSSVGIQPSEFAKIFMIIYMAKIIDKYKDNFNRFRYLIPILLIALAPIYLVIAQPALSAAIVTIFILLAILFASNIDYRYILVVIAVALPILFFFYYDIHNPYEEQILLNKIFKFYQQERVLAFFYPEKYPDTWYQTQQSIKAISSGQLLGRGLFNNVVYVPYAHNDFIFSIIGAELGFVGCISVIVVMIAIIAKCLIVAAKTTIFYARLVAVGVAAMLAFQSVINVCVAIGLLPNTGMVFPFVSSGGSAMWINMVGVGLVLNIGMTRTKKLFED